MAKVDVDLVIIGAGVAGINAAYRFQTNAPKDMTYALFEARDAIGGTWDLFRYPGIRSDSDIFTFGFEWNPWPKKETLAQGGEIKEYMEKSAAMHGIDKHIRFNHKVKIANWNSKDLCWELTMLNSGNEQEENPQIFRTRFLYLGTGYYDYDQPQQVKIPGIENFKGKIIHPQFWPEDYDYTRKNIVVIGSGATSVTLIPSLAERAKHVTMLQRSPTYILPIPRSANVALLLFSIMPNRIAYFLNRAVWIVQVWLMIRICARWPNLARKAIRRENTKVLPPNVSWDPHFNPKYRPWEQRLCASLDGDFFAAMRSGKASVATDTIKMVTEDTIKLNSGQELHPDVIVTATGLKLLFGGGIHCTVDGKEAALPTKFLWKGSMLQDVPNLFLTVGFENASWTLGCDCAAFLMTRMLWQIKNQGGVLAVPYLDEKEAEAMEVRPLLQLKATYLNNVIKMMPKGGTGVWSPRSNYMVDLVQSKYGDITTGLLIK